MMEQILRQVLKKHLSPFVLNSFDSGNGQEWQQEAGGRPSPLKLQIGTDSVSVADLQLDALKLNKSLGLGRGTYSVAEGRVGQVVIRVPWDDLQSRNISIAVSDVDIILKKQDVDLRSSGHVPFEQGDAQDSILDGSQSVQTLAELSRLATLIDTKLLSVELTVSNVRICIEHVSEIHGKPIKVHVTVPELHSVDATPLAMSGGLVPAPGSALPALLQRKLSFASASVAIEGLSSEQGKVAEITSAPDVLNKVMLSMVNGGEDSVPTQVSMDIFIHAIKASLCPATAGLLAEMGISSLVEGDSSDADQSAVFRSCIADSIEDTQFTMDFASPSTAVADADSDSDGSYHSCPEADDEFFPTNSERSQVTGPSAGQYDLDSLQADGGTLVYDDAEPSSPVSLSIQVTVDEIDLTAHCTDAASIVFLGPADASNSTLLRLALSGARFAVSHTTDQSSIVCFLDDVSVRQKLGAESGPEELCTVQTAESDEGGDPDPCFTCSLSRSKLGASEDSTEVTDMEVDVQLAKVAVSFYPVVIAHLRGFKEVADKVLAGKPNPAPAPPSSGISELSSLMEPDVAEPAEEVGASTKVSLRAHSLSLLASHGGQTEQVQIDLEGPSARTFIHSSNSGQEWVVQFTRITAKLLSAEGPAPFLHASLVGCPDEIQAPLCVTIKAAKEGDCLSTIAADKQWSGQGIMQMDDYQGSGQTPPAFASPVFGSPISSFPAKFEGEQRNPTTAHEDDIDAFRHQAMEASHIVAHLVLPKATFEIGKEDYDTLLKVARGIVEETSSALASLPVSKPEPSAAVASPSAMAVMLTLDDGNVILGPQTTEEEETHRFDVEIEGLRTFLLLNHKGTEVTYACLSLDGLKAKDTPPGADTQVVLKRPVYHTAQDPVLSSIIEMAKDATTATFSIRHLAAAYRLGEDWAAHVARFLLPPPTPQGSVASESAASAPTTPTTIYVNLEDVALEYRPSTNLRSGLVLTLERCQASTGLKRDGQLEDVKMIFNHSTFFAIDNVNSVKMDFLWREEDGAKASRADLLARMGYRSVGQVDFLDVVARLGFGDPEAMLSVELRNNLLSLDVCRDSFVTVNDIYMNLMDSFGADHPKLPEWYKDDGDEGVDAAPAHAPQPPSSAASSILGGIVIGDDYAGAPSRPGSGIIISEDYAGGVEAQPIAAPAPQRPAPQEYVVCRIEERPVQPEADGQSNAQAQLEALLSRNLELADEPALKQEPEEAQAPSSVEKPLAAASRREYSDPVLTFESDGESPAPSPAPEVAPASQAQLEARLQALVLDDSPAPRPPASASVSMSSSFAAAMARVDATADIDDDFVVVCDQEPKVRIFGDVPGEAPGSLGLEIKEDWTNVVQKEDVFTLAAGCPEPATRIRLIEFSVRISLFAGLDWAASEEEKRSPASYVDIHARQVMAQLDGFAESEPSLNWRLAVDITDLDILDHLPTSTWNKFLCLDVGWRRPDNTPMVQWLRENRKYHKHPSKAKNRMKLSTLPLRIFADLHMLEFFAGFFEPASGTSADVPDEEEAYYTRIDIAPIELKFDFKPRGSSTMMSKYKTVLLGLAPIEGAQLNLKRAKLRQLEGKDLTKALSEWWFPGWTEYAGGVAKGHGHLRSLVNVGASMADMVMLPVAQYRDSGRILTGLQRGTVQFLKTITTETLHVGSRLASGTQGLLEYGDGLLRGSSGTQDVGSSDQAISKYADQPADTVEGLQQAYESIAREMRTTADRIVAIPLEEYQRNGTAAYVSSVARAVPVAVFRPLVGLSEGVSRTFLGMRNELDKQAKLETDNKYKVPRPSPP